MINLDETIRQLAANGEAIRALGQILSDDQAEWQESPDTWSMTKVVGHLYNEERIDFRKHLVEMFSSPPLGWQPFHPDQVLPVESCSQALSGFLAERKDSIEWLKGLESPDWEITVQAPWGEISAGDVLASWVEHDFLHLRQMIEVLYAWNVQQAAPYSVQYAGDW